MSEFIEILFEKIDIKRSYEIFKNALTDTNKIEVTEATEHPFYLLNSKKSNAELIPLMPDGSVYFKLKSFVIDDIHIENIGLQIYRYGYHFDLSLDVVLEEIKSRYTVEQFQVAVASLARLLSAQHFCCGLDPATDLNTQFFSGSNFGPLKFS